MMDLDVFYRFVAILRGQGYSEPQAYHEVEVRMEEAQNPAVSPTQTGDQR